MSKDNMPDDNRLDEIWIESEVFHTSGMLYGKWSEDRYDDKQEPYIKKSEFDDLKNKLEGAEELYFLSQSESVSKKDIQALIDEHSEMLKIVAGESYSISEFMKQLQDLLEPKGEE